MLMSLRTGAHRDRALQNEWNAHGEEAFDFLVLEEFPDDLPAMSLGDALKSRSSFWQESLNALPLL